MKKICLAWLLLLSLLLSLAGCGGSGRDQSSTPSGGASGPAENQPDTGGQPDTGTPSGDGGGSLLDGLFGGGGSSEPIYAVIHPDFKLQDDGFIMPVSRMDTAPGSFIPISTARDFDKIRLNRAGNYILMADIDLSGIDWEPIGDWSQDSGFSGILEGNGYTVSNAGTSLFYTINGGIVQNLGVTGDPDNSSITRQAYDASIANCWFKGTIHSEYDCGGLVGSLSRSTITDCYNAGDIEATCAGGIAARARIYYEIRNCFNSGSVSAFDEDEEYNCVAAGIVGDASAKDDMQGRVEGCCNTGTITAGALDAVPTKYHNYGTYKAAGIVGAADDDPLVISRCYNTGTIRGADLSAGIVLASGEGTTVMDCYNAGDMTSSSPFRYGIAGSLAGSTNSKFAFNIINCYNVAACTGGIVNCSTALSGCRCLDNSFDITWDGALYAADDAMMLNDQQMRQESSYPFFDFGYTWQMGSGDYPYPVFAITDPMGDVG